MKTGERVFVGAFGFLLLGTGIYAMVFVEGDGAWRYLGGGALCALGINAVWGGVTGKSTWISKIGPLP